MATKIAVILLVALCLFSTATILACCKVSSDCARQEEKEHLCGLSECNGVDDDCPRRKDNG